MNGMPGIEEQGVIYAVLWTDCLLGRESGTQRFALGWYPRGPSSFAVPASAGQVGPVQRNEEGRSI